MEMLESIPLITRCWMGLSVLTSAAVYFGQVSVYELAWSFEAAYAHRQWWRCVTGFLWIGQPSFALAINLHFLMQNVRSYELGPVATGGSARADFTWQLACGAVALVALATWLRVPFVGLQLARYVQTLWCCQRPDAPVNLFGFEMEARWLPLASAGFGAVVDGELDWRELMGAGAGAALFHGAFARERGGLLATPAFWAAAWDPRIGVGDTVVISRLASAPRYNGMLGVVTQELANGRFCVEVGGVELSVRAAALAPVAPREEGRDEG